MGSRRDFVRICTMAGAAVGMSATTVSQIVEAAVALAFVLLFPRFAVAQPFLYVGTSGFSGHLSLCTVTSIPCDPSAVELHNAATGTTLASQTFGVAGLGGFRPQDIAVALDGRRVFATTRQGLVAIDVLTNQLTMVQADTDGRELEVSPDGTRIYWANANSVRVVDAASLMVLSSITLPEPAQDLARSADGAYVYATQLASNTVTKVSTASNTIVATFSAPDPGGIGVSPDGSRLYVVRMGQQQVTVLNAVSGATLATVSTTLPLGPFTRGTVVVSATTAYVSGLGSAVVFLDIASNTVRLAQPSSSPQGMALSGDGLQLFTATNEGVATLDSTTGTVVGSFPTVTPAVVVAVLPPLACLYEVQVSPRGVPLTGGTVNLSIPAPSGCSWSAATTANWLSIAPSLSGTGASTLSVTAAAATAPRMATVQIGAHVIPIPQTSPEIHVDLPGGQTLTQPAPVTGWAIDRVDSTSSASSPGVDAIHVWAYPLSGGAPIFVGTATYGLPRPDVSAAFGLGYDASGFSATVRGLPSGSYNLVFFAHSSRSGTFAAAALVAATVRRVPAQVVIDAPVRGSTVRGRFALVGWAIDASSTVAPGVDAIDVWAYPASGAPPQFVGSAAYGQPRPDVGLALGPQFTPSGFTLNVTGLLPGSYQLAVFPRSSDTKTFNPAAVVPITVAASAPLMFVDLPVANAAIRGAFSVDGWALDFSAATGSGVDAVHIWAYPAAGGTPIFVGAATAVSRPDVGAAFGSQYALSGFHLGGATLPAGTYDLVVFARSTLAGAFNNAVVIRMGIQ